MGYFTVNQCFSRRFSQKFLAYAVENLESGETGLRVVTGRGAELGTESDTFPTLFVESVHSGVKTD